MKAGEVIEELTRLKNGGTYDPNKTPEALTEAVEVIEDWCERIRRERQSVHKKERSNGKGEKITVIISKIDWNSLLAGITRQINIYRGSELHHYFGDHPEEEIIRVEIRKIDLKGGV